MMTNKPLSNSEIEQILNRMDLWCDYGPDPTDTILNLVETVKQIQRKQTSLLYELENTARLAHVLMRKNKSSSSYHVGRFNICQSSICSHTRRVLEENNA